MSITNEQKRILAEAQRILESQVCEEPAVTQPDVVAKLLQVRFGLETQEVFGVVLLDQGNHVQQILQLDRGIENRCHIYMKKIARRILNTNASGLIFFHNHPSGSLSFSPADRDLHKKLKDVFTALEYRVLDHIIVSHKGAASHETGRQVI